MHMSGALISPMVGVTMIAVSGAALVCSAVETKRSIRLED